MQRHVLLFVSFFWLVPPLAAQTLAPPYDLWTPDVLAAIRDRSTLELDVSPHLGYSDVYFTSNANASWFDARAPYAEHRGGKIRIHAFVAAPLFGGPYPALVIGHGHGGSADRDLTLLVASLGYVAFYIDGPNAGQSFGGPVDDDQAWISVDNGPDHGYLYHYAYAGMRAFTVLEALAAIVGNPFRIDAGRLGVIGASMGGIFATYINGIDSRVRAAIVLSSAGNWHHTLRYPNSWLYNGIYTGTRDLPYNGVDPPNSIEDIDTDRTVITFINYFDPIRYAPRQHAPVLTLIGTHDQYFPLPNANLQLEAFTSAGANARFEKRLWLAPNAPHGFGSTSDYIPFVGGLRQWLDYSFGLRDRPLATPQVALIEADGRLRFEITLAEPTARLSGAQAVLYAATRIDSTQLPIRDFGSYPAVRSGDRFIAEIPAGARTASGDEIRRENVIYYATVTDAAGLPVSSLASKAGVPMDLSTEFTPKIEPFSASSIVVPVPPPAVERLVQLSTWTPLSDSDYQGIALSNPGDSEIAARVEARTQDGRIAAAEGLVNPAFISLQPHTERAFLLEEWFGPGARRLEGSVRTAWSDTRGGSLVVRGSLTPSLDEVGPLKEPAISIWLPVAPEQEPEARRTLRIFAASAASTVGVVFRDGLGTTIASQQLTLQAWGSAAIPLSSSVGLIQAASVELRASSPVSARLDIASARDSWSIAARGIPTASRYIQPHVEWNGQFRTQLLLVNPSLLPQVVGLTLRLPSGDQLKATAYRLIQPFATVSGTVESLLGIGGSIPRGAGWLELRSTSGPVVAHALAIDPVTGAAASSALDDAADGRWSLPFFVQSESYYTGLTIAVANDTETLVSIQAYDGTGALAGRADLRLGGRQSRAQLLSQWIPELPLSTTGHLVITSSGPISPLAYLGATDGRSLAAIPFTRIPE